MNEVFSLNSDFSRAALSEEEIKSGQEKVSALPEPFFSKYAPDFAAIRAIAAKHSDKRNILLEGNGGSISTIRAFESCFGPDTDKRVFMLDSDDPDYIAWLRKECPTEESLLIVINRSGNSLQTISGYLALQDYETVFITTTDSTLHKIGQAMNVPTYHTDAAEQPVSRFSSISEFHLIPAAIIGMDIEGITEGAQEMYARCRPHVAYADNPALQLALTLDKLEKSRYDEIFLSIYSKRVAGFFELITQLYHESVCKGGKGQTIYGGDAPENQHHTLQRFNSGKRNSVGLFLTVFNYGHDQQLPVPETIRDIPCRNIRLADFEKLSMSDIIHTEFEGTWKDTVEEGIPAIRLELGAITPQSVGQLVALLQYATYYSAVLRDVNPFDQPGVEKSKEYIFKLIAEK
jgi:glucose-6-phosphate isomerase